MPYTLSKPLLKTLNRMKQLNKDVRMYTHTDVLIQERRVQMQNIERLKATLIQWGKTNKQQHNVSFLIEGIMQQSSDTHHWRAYDRAKTLIEGMVLDRWDENRKLADIADELIILVCGEEGTEEPIGNFSGRDRVQNIADRWRAVNNMQKEKA